LVRFETGFAAAANTFAVPRDFLWSLQWLLHNQFPILAAHLVGVTAATTPVFVAAIVATTDFFTSRPHRIHEKVETTHPLSPPRYCHHRRNMDGGGEKSPESKGKRFSPF